jgi:hypothetical protein
VVQVHPGPPYKSTVNMRLLRLLPFSRSSSKKQFCQPFVNFTFRGSYCSNGGASLRNSRNHAAQAQSSKLTRPEGKGPQGSQAQTETVVLEINCTRELRAGIRKRSSGYFWSERSIEENQDAAMNQPKHILLPCSLCQICRSPCTRQAFG